MLSRVADAIYWMSRYIERAENYARFLDVNFNLSLEQVPYESEQWKPLVVITGDWELYESLYQKSGKQNIIYFLGFDPLNPNSIYNSILKARENARMVRPEITREVWEQINHLYYLVKQGADKKMWKKSDPRQFFSEVKKDCQLLYGIIDSTISHNEGWHFNKIGQMLERADKTSRVLDVKYHILLPTLEAVGSPFDLIQWAALLKSVSAYDMYRKKHGKLMPTYICEFLLLDQAFPRSIFSSLMHAEQSLHQISGSTHGYTNEAEKQLGLVKSQLEFTDIKDIFDSGLHENIDNFQKQLNRVSTAIYDTFFAV